MSDKAFGAAVLAAGAAGDPAARPGAVVGRGVVGVVVRVEVHQSGPVGRLCRGVATRTVSDHEISTSGVRPALLRELKFCELEP